MSRDPQNGPFKYTKVLTEHLKEPRLTILLVNPVSSATTPDINIVPTDGSLEIIRYERVINGIPCQIIETPTLCALLSAATLDPVHIKEIQAQMSTIQYIWFATRLDATTLSINEQNIIKWLSTILGEQAWNYALLVLTHARTTPPLKCASMMKKRSEIVRAEISRHCGWDIARSITAIPVGHLDELLLDEQNLWPELHTTLDRQVTPAQSAAKGWVQAVPWQVSDVDEKMKEKLLPRLNALTLCYLWSGPAGALGMCLWGPVGFGIGLAGNALFWAVIGWLQSSRES